MSESRMMNTLMVIFVLAFAIGIAGATLGGVAAAMTIRVGTVVSATHPFRRHHAPQPGDRYDSTGVCIQHLFRLQDCEPEQGRDSTTNLGIYCRVHLDASHSDLYPVRIAICYKADGLLTRELKGSSDNRWSSPGFRRAMRGGNA